MPYGFRIDVYKYVCYVASRGYLFSLQTSGLIDPALSILTLSQCRTYY